MNEVVTRCSLFTGILFVHPGLKHSYEIRAATLARQMLFEQLDSVRVDGHAAVFGCLSQAVSEFPVQVERHVHLNTPLCKDARVAVWPSSSRPRPRYRAVFRGTGRTASSDSQFFPAAGRGEALREALNPVNARLSQVESDGRVAICREGGGRCFRSYPTACASTIRTSATSGVLGGAEENAAPPAFT